MIDCQNYLLNASRP